MTLDELRSAWSNPDALWTSWMVSLMSGTFTKARHSMQDGPNCFCALGLLEHIAGCHSEFNVLSAELAEFLDITPCGIFKEGLDVVVKQVPRTTLKIYSIAGMNDKTNLTLPEIGRYLEKNRSNLERFGKGDRTVDGPF